MQKPSPDPDDPGTYTSTVNVTGFIVNDVNDSQTDEVEISSIQYKVENNDYINLIFK